MLLPALAPAWASDIGHLSAVIVAEVYGLLITSLCVVLGRPHDRLRLRVTNVRELGMAAMVWAGAWLLTFGLHWMIARMSPQFPSPGQLARDLLFVVGTDMGRLKGADLATWILAAGRATILAPIAEELLFRGALFGWLRQHLSAWPTIALTALAFAIIHAGVPAFLSLAVAVGLAAGYARERCESVTPLIVLHTLQNTLLVVAAFPA